MSEERYREEPGLRNMSHFMGVVNSHQAMRPSSSYTILPCAESLPQTGPYSTRSFCSRPVCYASNYPIFHSWSGYSPISYPGYCIDHCMGFTSSRPRTPSDDYMTLVGSSSEHNPILEYQKRMTELYGDKPKTNLPPRRFPDAH